MAGAQVVWQAELRMFSQFRGTPETWNKLIAPLPGAHVLQTWEWAQVKSRHGWQLLPLVWQGRNGETLAAAMALMRSVRLAGRETGLRVFYVPKGPLLDWQDGGLRRQVLSDLAEQARRKRAIFVKIDADVPVGFGFAGQEGSADAALGLAVQAELGESGWRLSEEQIQFRNTLTLDLSKDEEMLLAQMKQKTRYNIRLAERKGVRVRVAEVDETGLLYRIYAETAHRDGFVIREGAYYEALWRLFFKNRLAEALIAEAEGKPLAALVIFHFAGRAWYMHGMSTQAQREKMPNYLLQWEAIRRLKRLGIETYDLWGAPDEFNESDPMWGVFRFKEGLGGQVVRHIGAWDLPLRPMLYRLYTHILPRLLDVMRRRGIERTRHLVG
ncbi:MAG: hypothetical protein B6D39_09210 [Anaerolineae bacterium UTCFX2]|nr:MAG: hypothetical protein B6D39_09210 [Anaerolineae bacterium UTCFX2]